MRRHFLAYIDYRVYHGQRRPSFLARVRRRHAKLILDRGVNGVVQSLKRKICKVLAGLLVVYYSFSLNLLVVIINESNDKSNS